jgi:hypothetical protein
MAFLLRTTPAEIVHPHTRSFSEDLPKHVHAPAIVIPCGSRLSDDRLGEDVGDWVRYQEKLRRSPRASGACTEIWVAMSSSNRTVTGKP